ncbi:MAG: hypothetical protein KatS3mg130_1817 [Candidatus Sumerlaea sp.]|jgi:hypothetical protein|uniref:Uncharacterized protein n=1 Tax=Sumerlaea chitinivorans TaxID=2250252 RepID=A0A2Z4Y410_SUMC1|nr:hypothetical protein BRCON_0476 [Candidatus Sumerlaea chitinivorans]MCX7963474.1 hypothetical protein [Candidatus Sumerlaea chitinivorans]GIX45409.1 MAG: hypothetical protein KatS3mg130_1817 [Candidatus Sumerlaea sp.]
MPKNPKPFDDEDEEDQTEDRGHCRDCVYYDVDREEDEEISDETLAPCIHPDLEEYELIVSGDSGCNLFEAYEEELEDEEEEDEEDEY